MIREELMVQAAKKGIERISSHTTLYKGTIDEIEVYEPDDMIDMFKLGAEWSDENPKEDIAELKKTIKALKERLQFEMENKHKHFDNYLDR
jgi:hypothetical protein